MNFSTACKEEAAQAERNECCRASMMYGMLAFGKRFSKDGFVLALPTRKLAEYTAELLSLFGASKDAAATANNERNWLLTISNPELTERVLLDLGYSGNEPNFRINDQNFRCEGCVAAFVAGAFISSGTVTDPERGYHLEFYTHKKKLCEDFYGLLKKAGFEPKTTVRGYSKVIYFKESAQIEDLLAFIGATDAAFGLMDQKIVRDIRNSVNRRTNCESANIDKTVASAQKDIAAIQKLGRAGGFCALPQELEEIARLRCENPELSLSELGELCETKISKSGVSHRLARIRAVAEDLK